MEVDKREGGKSILLLHLRLGSKRQLTNGDSPGEARVRVHEAFSAGFHHRHEVAPFVHPIGVEPHQALEGREAETVHLKSFKCSISLNNLFISWTGNQPNCV